MKPHPMHHMHSNSHAHAKTMAKPNAFTYILKPIKHALKSIAKTKHVIINPFSIEYPKHSNIHCELVCFPKLHLTSTPLLHATQKYMSYTSKAKPIAHKTNLTTKRHVVSPVNLSLATIRATCGKESVSTTTQ